MLHRSSLCLQLSRRVDWPTTFVDALRLDATSPTLSSVRAVDVGVDDDSIATQVGCSSRRGCCSQVSLSQLFFARHRIARLDGTALFVASEVENDLFFDRAFIVALCLVQSDALLCRRLQSLSYVSSKAHAVSSQLMTGSTAIDVCFARLIARRNRSKCGR